MRLAAGGLLLGAAVLGALWQSRLREPERPVDPPRLSGHLPVDGIRDPVRVDRDRLGIPHVDAGSEADAFFGLGFVHAQDRLEQLLALRRRARGTAAEKEGAAALDGDRLARLIDFAGLAERQWPQMSAPGRRALEAYAAGVSARMRRLASPPPEAADDPWRPQDSLAVYKLFAWTLSESIDASLVLNELMTDLGAVEAARFFPPERGEDGDARRATAGIAPASFAAPPWLEPGAETLRRATGLAGFGVGSTAFAVSGRATRSGRPVLVADTHFEPTAPAALHLAHLRAPGIDVAGATLPGVPVFWWGRNADVAWAAVHAGVVVTDLYAETTRNQATEYHDGKRWQALETREETLRVRGGADVALRVARTARGPLLPSTAPGEAISVSWTGARVEAPSGVDSLLAVARATDADALRAALRLHPEPPIALVWIEAEGAGGLQVAGWIPHRTLASQLLPLPGRARWYAWSEPVPFDALDAATLGSKRTFVVAADQPFTGTLEDAPIDSLWRGGTRRDRLVAQLRGIARADADLRGLASLALDVRLDRSLALIETALGLVGEPLRAREAVELVETLRRWDGRADPGSVGATVYHTYLHVLAEALFAERMGRERWQRFVALRPLDLEGLVLEVLREAASGEAADVWAEPAAVSRAVVESLRETWLSLAFERGADPRRWAWGEVHRLSFRGPGGADGPLGSLPFGGSAHAVLAGAYAPEEAVRGHFPVRVAPTARFAVDAEALDLALVALAPGQSERPGEAHWDDGVAPWLEGRHGLLATRRLDVEDRSLARLVLEPGGAPE